MVGWCSDLDGRRERDERAKPTVGRAGNLSDGIVAVFFMVRFQEKEMRKALKEIIRLVEGWVDSDERKAEATMLEILNTTLEVV